MRAIEVPRALTDPRHVRRQAVVALSARHGPRLRSLVLEVEQQQFEAIGADNAQLS